MLHMRNLRHSMTLFLLVTSPLTLSYSQSTRCFCLRFCSDIWF